MPRVFSVEDTPEDVSPKGACSTAREDLKLCLKNADCIKNQKRKVRDCYEANELPLECLRLRTLLFECKRSLLDNRLRFRGRKDY